MTNDEIRAIKTAAVKFHAEASMTGNSSDHICALLACIETLLAREAEVLEWIEENGFDLFEIRAILNPQPAALAEENDKP